MPAVSPPGAAWPSTTAQERVFPAQPSQVGAAREFLAAVLAGCPAAGDAVLCLSELASNAVLHSASKQPGGTFTVRAEISGNSVTLHIKDNGGHWAEQARNDGRGHGLDIVSELAADWGRAGGPLTGWLVWATLEWP